MVYPQLDRKDISQLLREAGCPDEFARKFLMAEDTEGTDVQLQMLRDQRHRQLKALHDEGKRLDQLDLLCCILENRRTQSKAEKE